MPASPEIKRCTLIRIITCRRPQESAQLTTIWTFLAGGVCRRQNRECGSERASKQSVHENRDEREGKDSGTLTLRLGAEVTLHMAH